MKTRPLILFIIAVALFVWFETEDTDSHRSWTKIDNEGAAERAASAGLSDSATRVQDKSSPTAQWNAGSVTLNREPDGHFYADVLAENTPVRMMVDTGATVVALTGQDARRMGITWNNRDLRPVARGAGGMVNGFPVTIKRMDLGNLPLTNVKALVLPEGLPISLLGQSFLNRLSRMEVSGERMVLGG